MLDHVEQQFSRRLEEQHSQLLALGLGLGIDFDLDRQATGLAHVPAQPLDGGRQTDLVENRRTELNRQRPRLGDALVQQVVDPGNGFRDGWVVRIAAPQGAQVQAGGIQKLLQVVVKNLRQAATLAMLGPRQLGGQPCNWAARRVATAVRSATRCSSVSLSA